MEIIKTYNTRRSTRGSTNPPPPQQQQPQSSLTTTTTSPPDENNADDTDRAAASSTASSTHNNTNTANPAIQQPSPTVVAVVPKSSIVTRRSTGRAATRAAAANNASSSTQSESSVIETTREKTVVVKEETKKEDINAKVIANLPPSVTNQSSVRSSTRARRGSSSSTSSNTTSTTTSSNTNTAAASPAIPRRRSGRAKAAAAALPQQQPLRATQTDNNNANPNQRSSDNNANDEGASTSSVMRTTRVASNENGTDGNVNANVVTIASEEDGAEVKENGNNKTSSNRKIASTAEEPTLERSAATTGVTREKAANGLPSSSSSQSLALLQIEKNILTKEAALKASKSKESSSKAKENSSISSSEGGLSLQFATSDNNAVGKGNLSSASSDHSSNFDEEEETKHLSTIHLTLAEDGRIYVNPINSSDTQGLEEGETFTVDLPTKKIKSPSNPLPGLPTASSTGRSRKSKPQAVTYGGDSSVGFLDPSVGSQVTMEVGQQLHRSNKAQLIRQNNAAVSEPSIVMTLETHTGGDCTASSAIVSLEVPTGSIDPNDFVGHFDPQSIAVLENVLQSDQGRKILTEMGVTVPDSEGVGWDAGYNSGGTKEDSSGGLTAPMESPSSTTASSATTPLHRGPGRPPGRPSSGGGRGNGRGTGSGSTPNPNLVARKVSESDAANIRRSQRQQDKFERQEAERIREENQLMLQREKEQMQALQQAQVAQTNPMSPSSDPQHQSVNVGIVSSTPVTPVQSAGPSTPLGITITTMDKSNIDSNSEKSDAGGNGRRPVRNRKLPAHLADPNYLSLEDAASAVREATRRSSTTQEIIAIESNEECLAGKPVQEAAKLSPTEETEETSPVVEVTEEQEATEEEEDDYTDDDPNKLWCVCRQPHNNRFMICCDRCEDWFHGKCVNITKAQGNKIELENRSWYCPNCKEDLAPKKKVEKEQKVQKTQPAIVPVQKTPTQVLAVGSDKGRKKSVSSGVAVAKEISPKQSTKPSAKLLAQQAEVEAAAAVAITAEPPSKIKNAAAAAAAGRRGRKRSEKAEAVEDTPATSGTNCVICKKPARSGSVYCSDLCVQKYAENCNAGTTKSATIPSPTSPTTVTPSMTADATTPTSKSPGQTKPLKRSQSQKDNVDPIFAFHVINTGTSVSTEVVPAKPKELTASQLLKAQKEKAQQEKAAALSLQQQASSTQAAGSSQKTPTTPGQQVALPTVPGISPNSVKAIVNSSPIVVVKEHDSSSASKGMKIINSSSSSSASATLEQNDPVPSAEKPERTRASSVSDSVKSNRSTSSSASSSKSGTVPPKIERKDSQTKLEQQSKADGPSSEKLHQDNMRKTFKETLKNRSSELSSLDKKKMDSAGITPDSVGAKIGEELVSLFGSASNSKCKNKYRSIWFNLKNEKNSIFRDLLVGILKPYDLVRMTPEQMAPSELAKWRKQEEEKGLEAIKRAELDKLAEAKKQELIDKGVEDAVQVAEEIKPLDISDVITDPDDEKKKDDKSKDKESRSSHRHRDRQRDKDRTKDKESASSSDHKSSRDKDKDRKHDHKHTRHSERDRDKDKDKKSDKERYSSSSSSSRHKSSHHEKDKEKSRSEKDRERDKGRERRDSDRHKDKEREKDKVKHDKDKEKERESRSDRERSSRHTRSKDQEKEKPRQKDKEKDRKSESDSSNVSIKEVKVSKEEKSEKFDDSKMDQVKTMKEELKTVTADSEANDKLKEESGTDSGSTVTTSTSLTDSPTVVLTSPTLPVSVGAITGKNEDVRHASVDSEQELPSSSIKTPDFAEASTSAAGVKKDGEQESLFQTTITMAELGDFKAAVYNVSHEDGELTGPFFPDSPAPIIGRISPQTVWDYIDKMKKSKEIITFRLTPATTADAQEYQTFFSYLSSRGRLGVIGGICHPLKDVYLIPLEKHQPLPRCLLPFRGGPGLPDERTHCLLAVVTRHASGALGTKRKLSSGGADNVKKKTKITGPTAGERLLRSSRPKDVKQEQSGEAVTISSGEKEDDNEPYEPWGEDDEDADVSAINTTKDDGQHSMKELAVMPAAHSTPVDLQAELMRINMLIEKEKQDILVLEGSRSGGGIPGLDGDFPSETSVTTKEEDSMSFLKSTPSTTTSNISSSPSSGLSSLDPRSTRSNIFKNQQHVNDRTLVKTPQNQISPHPPQLQQQSNSSTVSIPGLEISKEDSSSPPHLEPETEPKVIDLEEAYSPTTADEEQNSPGVEILEERPAPLPLGTGDIDERQIAVAALPAAVPILHKTSCGDIDERVPIDDTKEVFVVPAPQKELLPPTLPPPPLINLDDKQTEEIKIILSKFNSPVKLPTPVPVPPIVPDTIELDDDSEPPPPGEAPILPPLRSGTPPQPKNKIFEDSPFEKPALKLGGQSTPSKLKININLSTKSLPNVADKPEPELRDTEVDKSYIRDIDERLINEMSLPPTLIAEALAPTLPQVDLSLPPPIPLPPLHLPPPPLQQPPLIPSATTSSVVINLNVPPPPFIPGLTPPSVVAAGNMGYGQPPPGMPPLIQQPEVLQPGQSFLNRPAPLPTPPKPAFTASTRSPMNEGRSPVSEGRSPLSGGRSSGIEPRDSRDRRDTFRRNVNYGSMDHRRGRDERRRHRSRSRGRSRSRSRSKSRSRSRDRNKRRRRHSRSRSKSRSPMRNRVSRRNRSRSRSRSPVL